MSYVDWIGPSLLPLILLSCAGCLIMIGSNKGSSSLRRLVASAFLLSLLVVLASYWIRLPEPPPTPLTDMERITIMVSTRARETWSWQWLLFAPAFYVVLMHLVGLASLARARRWFTSGPEGLTKDRLFICPHAVTAYAYGYFKPTIVLPSSYLELNHAELIAVIRHEEAHLRQGDPTLIPIINLLQGLLWWNPFVHLLARAWRIESERAADDAALASGIPPARYARQLINLAQGLAGRPPLAGSAFIGRGRLKSRIQAVVNPEIRRKNMKASHKYMTVAGCTAAALALSVVASARWHSAQVINEPGPQGAVWGYVETKPGHFTRTYKVNGKPLQQTRKFERVNDKGEIAFEGKARTASGEVVFKGEPLNEVTQDQWKGVTGTELRGKVVEDVVVEGKPMTGKTIKLKADGKDKPNRQIDLKVEEQAKGDAVKRVRGEDGTWVVVEGQPLERKSEPRWKSVPTREEQSGWTLQRVAPQVTIDPGQWRFSLEERKLSWRFVGPRPLRWCYEGEQSPEGWRFRRVDESTGN